MFALVLALASDRCRVRGRKVPAGKKTNRTNSKEVRTFVLTENFPDLAFAECVPI